MSPHLSIAKNSEMHATLNSRGTADNEQVNFGGEGANANNVVISKEIRN